MPSEPCDPHAGPTRTSRKRQVPLDDNGEPVTIQASKKRKVVPPAQQTAASTSKKTTTYKRLVPLDDNGEPVTIQASKKRKVVPPAQQTAASTSKKTTVEQLGPLNKNSTKFLPDNKGKKTRRQSVDIEDVPDEDDRVPSNPPRNPGSILELVTDDERSSPAGSGGESEEIKVLEDSEEDEEAELSKILFIHNDSCSPNTFQHACPKNGPRLFMCFSSQLRRLNTRTADAVMCLNARLQAAKGRILATSAVFLTKEMRTRQGIFSGMQGLAGVLK